MAAFDPCLLQPGDVMLYRPRGVVGWLIASRTWSQFAHVEVAVSRTQSFASRDGIGVNIYDIRTSELACVLRHPTDTFNLELAMEWARTNKVIGQKYDYLAIARFMLPHFIKRDLDPNRQICSAASVRFTRGGCVRWFSDAIDADLIAPCNFRQVPSIEVWSDGKP